MTRGRGSKPPQGRSVLEPDRSQHKVIRTDQGHPWRLLALLIGMTAAGPLSLNILAPARPGRMVAFGAEPGAGQLRRPRFRFGMAGPRAVVVPRSDRFGAAPRMAAGPRIPLAG